MATTDNTQLDAENYTQEVLQPEFLVGGDVNNSLANKVFELHQTALRVAPAFLLVVLHDRS